MTYIFLFNIQLTEHKTKMSDQNISNKNINSSNNVDFDVKFQTQMECKQVELLSHKDIDELLARKGVGIIEKPGQKE